MLPEWLDPLIDYLPAVITAGLVVVGLVLTRVGFDRVARKSVGIETRGNVLMLVLTIAGLILTLVMLPISDSLRGQILTFFGIVVSAAIALSSTTFLGNAMAGLMLRAVRNFRPGDFLRVGEHFGRVSERGIFHTEIQTADRDLTTIPNLHLVNQPVTVIRSSGTILSATVSLGYDVGHARVERLLLQAAAKTGLREPFVHVLELGDFSVSYRVAGLLSDVGPLLSARSQLRVSMLDALHEGGVEIVSPHFMNHRRLDPANSVMPAPRERAERSPASSKVELLAFDKAQEAASEEQRRDRVQAVRVELAEIGEALGEAVGGALLEVERGRLQERRERLMAEEASLAERLDDAGE